MPHVYTKMAPDESVVFQMNAQAPWRTAAYNNKKRMLPWKASAPSPPENPDENSKTQAKNPHQKNLPFRNVPKWIQQPLTILQNFMKSMINVLQNASS